MGEDKPLEVEILERREVLQPTTDDKERAEVWITYRFGDLPPGLVRIPKEGLNDKKVRDVIKADIDRRVAKKPEKLRL